MIVQISPRYDIICFHKHILLHYLISLTSANLNNEANEVRWVNSQVMCESLEPSFNTMDPFSDHNLKHCMISDVKSLLQHSTSAPTTNTKTITNAVLFWSAQRGGKIFYLLPHIDVLLLHFIPLENRRHNYCNRTTSRFGSEWYTVSLDMRSVSS